MVFKIQKSQNKLTRTKWLDTVWAHLPLPGVGGAGREGGSGSGEVYREGELGNPGLPVVGRAGPAGPRRSPVRGCARTGRRLASWIDAA
jgi:hypothetical protein